MKTIQKLTIMISKQILRKRLGVAIGKSISPKEFSWFFGRYCEKVNLPDLKNAKQLTYEEVEGFSRYAGYDLKYPIPIPFLT